MGVFVTGPRGSVTKTVSLKCTSNLSSVSGSSKQQSEVTHLSYCVPSLLVAEFKSTISYTDAETAAAPNLEPAFEHLLRSSMVHENIITTLRINAIIDRDTFVNMFDSEATLKQGAADLGTDLVSGGLAKVMTETKLQTDAVARAHGVPVTLWPADWTAVMTEFKNKHGTHIPDDRLPAQSCFEHFIEKVGDGTLKAEPLSLIVSAFEEEQQDAKKPDVSRQFNLQLDSRLTISTKRRHTSTEPADEIALRAKYSIMTNL